MEKSSNFAIECGLRINEDIQLELFRVDEVNFFLKLGYELTLLQKDRFLDGEKQRTWR